MFLGVTGLELPLRPQVVGNMLLEIKYSYVIFLMFERFLQEFFLPQFATVLVASF